MRHLNYMIFLVLFVSLSACVPDEDKPSGDPNESFLSLLGSGKQDAILIEEGSPEALGILAVVNELSRDQLDIEVGLDARAAEAIDVYRVGNIADPHDDRVVQTLDELDAIPWVGMSAFISLYEFALDRGYIDRFRRPLTCAIDADCGAGDTVCWFGRCGDVTNARHRGPRSEYAHFAATTHEGGPSAGKWTIRSSGPNSYSFTTGRGVDVESVITTPVAERPRVELTREDVGAEEILIYDDRLKAPSGPELTFPSESWRYAGHAFKTASGNFVLLTDPGPRGGPSEYAVYRQTQTTWQLELELTIASSYRLSEAHLGFADDGIPRVFEERDGEIRIHERTANGVWKHVNSIDLNRAGFRDDASSYVVRVVSHHDGRSFISVRDISESVSAVFVVDSQVSAHRLGFVAFELTPTPTGVLAWDPHNDNIARIEGQRVDVLQTPFVSDIEWLGVDIDGNVTAFNRDFFHVDVFHLQLR